MATVSRILDVHGLTVRCEAESESLADELVRPLKFFVKEEGRSDVTVIVSEGAPPYDRIPKIEAQFSTPRNVVYRNGHLKVIDYFGRGAILHEDGVPVYRIYSLDRNLLCESFYLLMLSLLGQYCDSNGLLRVHALAVSRNDTAVVMMIPQGGGKSTMAFRLLEESPVKLISDDDPIVARNGDILPFPRALGLLDGSRIEHVPRQHVYSVDRMEFGLKYFVDCEYWKGKIQEAPLRKTILFTTRRVLNGTPGITRASKRRALAALMRDAVFGIGLYQGIEFMFNRSTWEVAAKATILFRRFVRALRFVRASQTYELTLSDDVAKNCQVVQEFLETVR